MKNFWIVLFFGSFLLNANASEYGGEKNVWHCGICFKPFQSMDVLLEHQLIDEVTGCPCCFDTGEVNTNQSQSCVDNERKHSHVSLSSHEIVQLFLGDGTVGIEHSQNASQPVISQSEHVEKYTCQVSDCNRKYKTRAGLYNHLRMMHFICCGFSFCSSQDVYQHYDLCHRRKSKK